MGLERKKRDWGGKRDPTNPQVGAAGIRNGATKGGTLRSPSTRLHNPDFLLML